MTDVSKLKELQTELDAKRGAILAAVAEARQNVEDLQRQLSVANSERERLQAICNRIRAENREDPPLEMFARVVLDADEIANSLIDAEKVLAAANDTQDAKLKQLEHDGIITRRKIHQAELAAKVIEYENAVQRAGLGRLSDEIRKLAMSANVQLEQHSPLISQDRLLIAGYPIKAWGGTSVQISIVNQETRELIETK